MIFWLVLKLERLVIELYNILKDFGFFERIFFLKIVIFAS
jgi:hypothetical protein